MIAQELVSTYDLDWNDGTVEVFVGAELQLHATPKEPIRAKAVIGTLEAYTFSLVHAAEAGRRLSTGDASTAARLRRIADVLDRVHSQDRHRLERHRMLAARTASRMAAAMSAYIDGAERGRVTLPGPHGEFRFQPSVSQETGASAHHEFHAMLEREALMAPAMLEMTMAMRGTNLEIRIGPCVDIVPRIDAIETMRVLAECDGEKGA